MSLLFKWLFRLLLAGFALGLIGVFLVYYLASRSLIDYDADYTVAGITGPVEIVRNSDSIPHIFGETDADVLYGLGFVHAQDRLWQMMLMRRTAQGRLSELFGARSLSIDRLMRRLDLYGAATDSVATLDAPTVTALDAYSDGVNAWIAQVNADALGRGAPEFFLFPTNIAPWQPADTLAVMKFVALQLTAQASNEVTRARVSLALTPERLRDILPDDPGQAVAEAPEFSSLLPDIPREILAAQAAAFQGAFGRTGSTLSAFQDSLSPSGPRGRGGASNAWAASPDRATSPGSLMANDPHLTLTAPSIWYLARLELTTGGVIGATVPGIPTVLVGRSDEMGWGLTSSYLDDQDLMLERRNPDNPGQVLGPNGWEDVQTRISIIEVKDADPVTLTLEWSANGPLLEPGDFGTGAVTPAGHAMALSWTALARDDRSITSALNLMRAKSVTAAISALNGYVAPAHNLMLADRSRIALKSIGAMPARNAAHQSQGRMPAPGWIVENRWQGIFPYADNPEYIDPEGGILGNTNNKVIDRPFPNHMSFDWGDSQRIQRWRKLMQGREVHTRESFIEAQLDTVSVSARALLPLIAADLWFTGDAAPAGTIERQRQRALELLAEWNGEMNEHLPEPLIYAAWMRALQDRLIRDELGPLAREFTHVDPVFLERVYRDIGGAAVWCDITQSAAPETCTDVARQALDDAILWITENHSGNLESLRWGDAHQAHQDHPVLGAVPILGPLVNIRQSTSGGDGTLMRAKTKGTDPEPFANTQGASYRGVYDFADPDSSVFMIATGQSGHPLSRHYDDLGELWRRGDYIPMSLDPDLARAAAIGTITLTPAN